MPLSLMIYSEFFLSLPSIKKRDLICAHALVVETFEIISANLIIWHVLLLEKSHFSKKVDSDITCRRFKCLCKAKQNKQMIFARANFKTLCSKGNVDKKLSGI